MHYRLIVTAGSELAIVNDDRPEISEGDTVQAPDGSIIDEDSR